jgi:hypothetical protein
MSELKNDARTPREKICTMTREELKKFILANDPNPDYKDCFFKEVRICRLRIHAHVIAMYIPEIM